ncbi:MAG: ABC transporter ATP-binding protein, partial [Candidatus Bathyarchaeia archaeon]
MDDEPLVKMVGITKFFPNVVANDSVNFELKRSEIHGLLGENGAGKTTLMNILYGIYKPDKGEIYIEGKPARIKSPRDAIRLGIGMVSQFPDLVENMTVAENLAPLFPGKILRRERIKEICRIAEEYGLPVDAEATVYDLSLGERQRVEVLKALIRGVKILILDEPTTVLTQSEVNSLFKAIRKMRSEDKGIIFVSHKLPEVLEITDRITVLRRGRVVATLKTRETNEEELAKLMVGRAIVRKYVREKTVPGEEVLKVEDLYVLNDKGGLAVKGLSFSVRRGEIFGIAGVSGNGQKELVEALTGLRRVEKGRIIIDGSELTSHLQFRRVASHIPDDRIGMGILPSLSVLENLALISYRRFSKFGLLKSKELEQHAKNLVEKYSIITPSLKAPVWQLSGGNLARLILARETSTNYSLIIAVHPTFGLDVASTEETWKLLLELRKKAAILLVSEDLEEIIQLSDRIGVMYRGEFMGILESEEADAEKIGLMM